MNGVAAGLVDAGPLPRPRPWLALAFAGLWVAAAFAARSVGLWASVGTLAAVLGAAVFIIEPAPTRALLRPTWRLVALGAVMGLLMAMGTSLLYPLAAQQLPLLGNETEQLYRSLRGPPPWLVAVGLVPVIVGEELVWRGLTQGALVGRFSRWTAAALATVAYAAAHLTVGSAALALAALGCGAVWSALRAHTGSLVPPLIAHLAWDAVVLLWLPLLPR